MQLSMPTSRRARRRLGAIDLVRPIPSTAAARSTPRPVAPRASVAALALAIAAPAAAQERPWQIGLDALVYTDTDHVQAYTPAISVRRSLDADGSRVGASAAVDVVSAASVDVVSHATTRFLEARTQGTLDAAAAIGDQRLSLAYRFSWEPDYLSNGLTAGWRSRLGTPDSVLDLTYGLTWDVVGRTGTPWSVFGETLFTHAAAVSFTHVLGPETVLRGVYSLTGQDGYLEKPYRYVPLFGAETVANVTLDRDTFDAHRLPRRPPESVPDRRIGHAFGARLVQHLAPIDGSLRLDYQLYVDDWSVTSHVAEAMVKATLTDGVRLAVYGRGYVQTGAFFWRRAYAVQDADRIPRWRTLDRDLSPYWSVTGGARFEWAAGDFGGYVDGAAMLTRWDDFLLLEERVAVIGQIGLRWRPR